MLSTFPLLLAGVSARGEGADKATQVPGALGYLPWWMAAGWQAIPLNGLDRLVLFDAPVERDGSVVDRAWEKRAPGLVAQAQRRGLKLDVALTMVKEGDFNVFSDPAACKRMGSAALRWLELPFVAGLHLDIEGFAPAEPRAMAGFRNWLQALDEARRRAGKGLSAFFPASDEFQPFDAQSAGRIDYWVAQLYDAHWVTSKVTGPLVTRTEQNPVAVPRALARLGAVGVPRPKILLSVPLYGWEWPSDSDRPGAPARGPAKLLTFAQTPASLMPNDRLAAIELARRHGLWRDGERTPYYAYRDATHWVQGWFEDVASLTLKLAPERAQGYAGLAFFPLGYDQGEVVEGMLRWWNAPPR